MNPELLLLPCLAVPLWGSNGGDGGGGDGEPGVRAPAPAPVPAVEQVYRTPLLPCSWHQLLPTLTKHAAFLVPGRAQGSAVPSFVSVPYWQPLARDLCPGQCLGCERALTALPDHCVALCPWPQVPTQPGPPPGHGSWQDAMQPQRDEAPSAAGHRLVPGLSGRRLRGRGGES